MTVVVTPVCLSLNIVLEVERWCGCGFIQFPSTLPTWGRSGFLCLLSEQRITENILWSSLQSFLPVHL